MEQGREGESSALEQRKAMWESGELQQAIAAPFLSRETAVVIGNALQKTDVVLKSMLKPEVVAGFQTVLQNMGITVASPQMAKFLTVIEGMSKATENVLRSPLMEYLVSARDADLAPLVDGFGSASVTIKATADARVISPDKIELERQIVGHLQSGESLEKLSPAQWFHLKSVLNLIRLIVFYLAAFDGARQQICTLQPKLLPSMTSNQIARTVRKTLCDVPVDFFNRYRSVKGEGVRLRAEPRMNAPEVQVTLQDRGLLEVLDSSNRDWLLVAVVAEEGVEGWISRKYTHLIHR